jgi:DNA-binding HxlR family transcriptional regulator/putative sterol carrier protein
VRSYGQACGLARALDLIGDRWTMLIARELLFLGPRRFTDLRAALPGMASNLLVQRLRSLEAAGLLMRERLPPPAASAVYRLTPMGQALEPIARELLRFGLRFLSDPSDEAQPIRPELPLIAFRAGFRAEAARGVHDVYEFRFDTSTFQVHVDDGHLDIRAGSESRADLTVTTDLRTFAGIVYGRHTPLDAMRAGRLAVSGNPDAARRFVQILGHERPKEA